jgi:hypothetical protein
MSAYDGPPELAAVARREIQPRLSLRITHPEALRQATEVYGAAIDQLFGGAELPACEHPCVPRRLSSGHQAAGTCVCVLHPDRLYCFLCVMSHLLHHQSAADSWRCSACGTSSEHLEPVNLTSGWPQERITLTGFKVCPTCGGHPAIDV